MARSKTKVLEIINQFDRQSKLTVAYIIRHLSRYKLQTIRFFDHLIRSFIIPLILIVLFNFISRCLLLNTWLLEMSNTAVLFSIADLKDQNKMSSTNLAIIFWPTLLQPTQDVSYCLMFNHYRKCKKLLVAKNFFYLRYVLKLIPIK